MTRAHFKFLAKQQREGKVGILFVASLLSVLTVLGILVVAGVIIGILSTLEEAGAIIGIALAVLIYFAMIIVVTPALSIGRIMMLQKIADKPSESIKATYIFKGFKHFWPAFKVMFFNGLFVFLWSLLFVIPGVIKSYSYSQAMYIIAENPELGALAAIRRSKLMMRGRKFDFFVLCELSFYPWFLLLPFTLGILAIWLVPYMELTVINFYNHAKRVPGSPVYGIPTYGEIVPAYEFIPAFEVDTYQQDLTKKDEPAEEPIVEETVEEPIVEEVAAEEPVTETATEEITVEEEPVCQETVVEEIIEEPIVEEAVEETVEEPAVEEETEILSTEENQ